MFCKVFQKMGMSVEALWALMISMIASLIVASFCKYKFKMCITFLHKRFQSFVKDAWVFEFQMFSVRIPNCDANLISYERFLKTFCVKLLLQRKRTAPSNHLVPVPFWRPILIAILVFLVCGILDTTASNCLLQSDINSKTLQKAHLENICHGFRTKETLQDHKRNKSQRSRDTYLPKQQNGTKTKGPLVETNYFRSMCRLTCFQLKCVITVHSHWTFPPAKTILTGKTDFHRQ